MPRFKVWAKDVVYYEFEVVADNEEHIERMLAEGEPILTDLDITGYDGVEIEEVENLDEEEEY